MALRQVSTRLSVPDARVKIKTLQLILSCLTSKHRTPVRPCCPVQVTVTVTVPVPVTSRPRGRPQLIIDDWPACHSPTCHLPPAMCCVLPAMCHSLSVCVTTLGVAPVLVFSQQRTRRASAACVAACLCLIVRSNFETPSKSFRIRSSGRRFKPPRRSLLAR
jgi:hypothetical protein